MSPFWKSFADHFSGCGKNPTLFLIALAGFFGLAIAAVTVAQELPQEYVPVTVAATAGVCLLWTLKIVKQIRDRCAARIQRERLSDDELSKARSKLRTSRRPAQLPKKVSG